MSGSDKECSKSAVPNPRTETVTFHRTCKLKDTMVFEKLFKPSLRLTFRDKKDLLFKECEWRTWMFINGQLMGETYAVRLSKSTEKIEGCNWFTKDSTAYIYSTAILPDYQGQGYGALLKAYFLGLLSADKTLHYAVGHAYEGASIRMCEHFGAIPMRRFNNWYKTGRSVVLYQQFLS
jgi:ribosomal protein S18 acetylase RimI-like enzyme